MATKKQKKTIAPSNDILINFILDRSGSMGQIWNDVIGGYNEFVKAQKEESGEARFSLLAFDTLFDKVYVNELIDNIPPLPSTIHPRGATALLDAVGKTIEEIKALPTLPEKVVFVIFTDGYENSSSEYKLDQVKDLIKTTQADKNWQYVFLGADQDAFAAGTQLGMAASGTFAFKGDRQGVNSTYSALTSSMRSYRHGATATVDMGQNDDDDNN